MNEKSSGTYIIDEDYNVLFINNTIKELYPSLEVGKKCYQCLMNLDEPCPPCPVANNIQGPQTYLDPIRNIYETVDAVEVTMENGKIGHALVMSTVGESATISAKLPRTKEELNKLLEQEYFDTLTEGYSRKGFIRQSEQIFSRNNKTDYGLILFDIRNFKALNDTFGNEAGDRILQFVFARIKDSFLKPVVSARLESDKFLFLVQKKNLQRKGLEKLLTMEWSGDSRNITMHLRCGIYFVEDSELSVSHMVDKVIFAKKNTDLWKKGNIALFDPAMVEKYIDQVEIISTFNESLRNNEFKIYYQPVIETASGRICSAEALIRWDHPTQGFIVPDRFIPALETSGFITQLDRYVLRKVYDLQNDLKNNGIQIVPISVNLSRQDFYDDSFVNEILDHAHENLLPAKYINYEITETAVAILKENCDYLIQQIRQAGSKVLLDDFGKGYSSLGMVGDYSFDMVKIDKSFIDQIISKPTVRAVIESTINMCHLIGLRTVAEGVENKEQLDYLKRFGCDCIQGYYYSKPLSEEDYREYLNTNMISDGIEKCRHGENRPHQFDLHTILDLVDNSGQFVQVCNPDNHTMVYANALTRMISGHPDLPYEGEKCYQYMLGLDAPCGHCPMKLMNGETEKEIEVDDGIHTFALKARYSSWNGRKVFIEYGRDITNAKTAQKRYADQIRGILENIPEGQGVFHMDLTDDKWLSSQGKSRNAREIQEMKNVDELIRRIGSFVPDKEGQDHFFKVFCRDSQLKEYRKNKRQIVLETKSYYDDLSIRWSRITAHIIDNPSNNHIESIIYGVDISKEMEQLEEWEGKQLRREVDEAWKLYAQADRDRRYDYLTGLNSRLDLYDFLKNAGEQKERRVSEVLFVDIDNFKQVNDNYGHNGGDSCLKAFGKILQDFGKANGITFYRFGGEEFVGLSSLHKPDIGSKAEELLEKIRGSKIHIRENTEIYITVSIGYTSKPDDYQKMIIKADKAMYKAKSEGKNRVVCADYIGDKNSDIDFE